MQASGVLVSYPKCGRTWLRLMLARAFQNEYEIECKFTQLDLEVLNRIDKRIPRLYPVHEDNPLHKKPQQLNQRASIAKLRPVVFLVRDPRDIVISAYFERTKRSFVDGTNFEGTLADFLYSEIGSLKTIVEYFNIWAKRRARIKRFQLLKYEQLHQEPVSAIQTVVAFLDHSPLRKESIEEAVEFASFTNMREIESERRCKTRSLDAW